MIHPRRLLYVFSRGFLFSFLILVPALTPLFLLTLYKEIAVEPKNDLQVEVTRDVIEKDFARFYPRRVFQIGIHIDDISDIKVGDRLFDSRFTFWAKNYFENSRNDRSEIGENDLRVVNTEKLDIETRAVRTIEGGEASTNSEKKRPFIGYMAFEANGSLKNDFFLRRYPFDKHKLEFVIEPRHLTAEEIILPIDPNSSLSAGISMGEWEVESFTGLSEIHEAKTDYSDPVLIQKGALWNYVPRVVFEVTIKRLLLSHLIKELFPLLIIMVMAYANFYVDPSEFETRSSVSFTSFLSITALHWVASGEQTGVSYITAMDEYFLVAYALVLLVIVEAVLSKAVLPPDANDVTKEAQKGPLHPWIRIGIPCLRVIYPIVLAGGWYWITWRAMFL